MGPPDDPSARLLPRLRAGSAIGKGHRYSHGPAYARRTGCHGNAHASPLASGNEARKQAPSRRPMQTAAAQAQRGQTYLEETRTDGWETSSRTAPINDWNGTPQL